MIGNIDEQIIGSIALNPENDNFKFYMKRNFEYLDDPKDELLEELARVIGKCKIVINKEEKLLIVKKLYS